LTSNPTFNCNVAHSNYSYNLYMGDTSKAQQSSIAYYLSSPAKNKWVAGLTWPALPVA
jgi:hypothetical protein